MRALLKCAVTSGQNAVRERFIWTFNGARENDDTNYAPGEILVATQTVDPNSSGTLTLETTFADGTTQSVTKNWSVGPGPGEPPLPNTPSQLGDIEIEWVEG